ncbi:unnamed protein product [Ceratitis capitata]|uniref:(Mediterranean fruit fly) hypothetical protein n=1 Tax=Ceratitis capitata TaxID=7213 RepID=A0A811U5B2_CERCA|nr:unnamed protein product [Ceratitis capitata]
MRHTQKLSPYIRHWEAADFDRTHLHTAHQKHIEQKRHRRKRELNSAEFGPVHTIRLNFFAHDREFRMILHQNPLSVFAGDVEIESTHGPVEYDISRIYTGSLEVLLGVQLRVLETHLHTYEHPYHLRLNGRCQGRNICIDYWQRQGCGASADGGQLRLVGRTPYVGRGVRKLQRVCAMITTIIIAILTSILFHALLPLPSPLLPL